MTLPRLASYSEGLVVATTASLTYQTLLKNEHIAYKQSTFVFCRLTLGNQLQPEI